MDKSARVKECLRRAGLERLPAEDTDDLRACGLDSLLSVLTLVELQREFGIRIPASAVTDTSFASVDHLAALIPDEQCAFSSQAAIRRSPKPSPSTGSSEATKSS
jgi:acyl carrier protein